MTCVHAYTNTRRAQDIKAYRDVQGLLTPKSYNHRSLFSFVSLTRSFRTSRTLVVSYMRKRCNYVILVASKYVEIRHSFIIFLGNGLLLINRIQRAKRDARATRRWRKLGKPGRSYITLLDLENYVWEKLRMWILIKNFLNAWFRCDPQLRILIRRLMCLFPRIFIRLH